MFGNRLTPALSSLSGAGMCRAAARRGPPAAAAAGPAHRGVAPCQPARGVFSFFKKPAPPAPPAASPAATPTPGAAAGATARARRGAPAAATWDADAGAGAAAAAARPALRPRSLRLDDLRDNPGAVRVRKRKGRGEGSGMGKTAGRGMKGTTSRAGGAVPLGFEGGQTPLWRRTPKIGFMNKAFQTPLEVVNLDALQLWIDSGRLDASRKVTMKVLLDSGIVSSCRFGVKLLARGATRLTHKLDIEVSAASAGAIAAVEAAGGSIKSVFYTPLALRALLAPHKFDLPVKSPRPAPDRIAYYTSFANRGYLAPEVQLGELRARLAAGVEPTAAASLLPVFVGGPVERAVPAGLAPAAAAGGVAATSGGLAVAPLGSAAGAILPNVAP